MESEDTDNAAPDTIVGQEPPVVKEKPGCITFIWAADRLVIDAKRYDNKGGAELTVWYDTGDQLRLVAQNEVHLLSPSSRNTLIRQLRDTSDEYAYINWHWILTCITYKVVKTARGGEPLKELWPTDEDSATLTYLLEPILYKNHPAVIFGDYGSLKSMLALIMAYVVQLPCRNNNLGLITKDEPSTCLYGDYEDEAATFQDRWGKIQRGFGVDAPMPILYQRLARPLADIIEEVQEIITDNNVKLLIIDSLGPAAGGNLNDPEPAIKYHEALRRLGITSLTLAHNSKDPLTKKRTIFGSVFFTNLARTIWECKADVEPGQNDALISLKHMKANLSRLYGTLGYRITFDDNRIAVAKADLADSSLASELPLTFQVKALLRDGPLAAQEISEALDRDLTTVRVTLTRMFNHKQVCKVTGHKWALATKEVY